MRNLPTLKGTEKQVKWANNIREAFIANSHYREYNHIVESRNRGQKVGAASEVKPVIGLMERLGITKIGVCEYIEKIEEALQIEDASWWIENRDRLRAGVVPGVYCEWFDEE